MIEQKNYWRCACIVKSPGLPDALKIHPLSAFSCPECHIPQSSNDPRPASADPHAGDLAAQIEARARRAYEAHAPYRTPEESKPETPDHEKPLIAAGYSPRALQVLPEMNGPALEMAEFLASSKEFKTGAFLLFGPTGRGKTVIATYLAAKRVAMGLSAGIFVDARDIFARMKQCWGKHEDSEVVMKRWRETPFLVIDEAQSRSELAWENTELDSLINKRYAHLRPTIIIGNYLDEKAAQESLGPRIIDRVRETGHLVPCDWASYRG